MCISIPTQQQTQNHDHYRFLHTSWYQRINVESLQVLGLISLEIFKIFLKSFLRDCLYRSLFYKPNYKFCFWYRWSSLEPLIYFLWYFFWYLYWSERPEGANKYESNWLMLWTHFGTQWSHNILELFLQMCFNIFTANSVITVVMKEIMIHV